MDLSILNTAENPIPTHAYAAFLAVDLRWHPAIKAKGHKLPQIPWIHLGSSDVVGQYQQLLDPNNQDNWPLQSHPLPIHLYHMVCF